jgi:predicted nucleotidyltransferase
MSTIEIFKNVKTYLATFSNIRFAMIFGSTASGKNSFLSDIDIAIYSEPTFELLEFGRIISELETIGERKIDLVELNRLNKSNNFLCYEIISNNKLLFNKDEKLFIDFKRKTLMIYFDQTRLREEFRRKLLERLKNNQFGRRLDARAIEPVGS